MTEQQAARERLERLFSQFTHCSSCHQPLEGRGYIGVFNPSKAFSARIGDRKREKKHFLYAVCPACTQDLPKEEIFNRIEAQILHDLQVQ